MKKPAIVMDLEDEGGDVGNVVHPVDGQVDLMGDPGSHPLEDQREELFARLKFQGMTNGDSYRESFNPECTDSTAQSGGTRIHALPRVRVRINFFDRQLHTAAGPAERKDAITICAQMMRNKELPEKIRMDAMDRLAKFYKWHDTTPTSGKKVPDPAFLMSYLSHLQKQNGVTPS